MNFRSTTFLLGQIIKMVAALLALPFLCSAVTGELRDPNLLLGYIIPAIILLAAGYVFTQRRPENFTLDTKGGLLTVGLSWILISVIGALPLAIGSRGNPLLADLTFIDWLFESTSGFSTTGATVLSGAQLESMSKGLLLWRSLSNWIGGMGILLFVLAILPQSSGASGMTLLAAEQTGHSVGKLVSKTAVTAKILYFIYAAMTMAEILFLLPSGFFEGGTGVFDAITLGFSTAGTGGFVANAGGIGAFNVYVQAVIGVFMFLFGVSFSVYYLIILGRFRDIVKSEELRFYVLLLVAVFLMIAVNIHLTAGSGGFADALGVSAFTAVSLMTSTGFDVSAASPYLDFSTWNAFSQTLLFLLMFIGACGGSTGGGLKCSRTIIIIKSAWVRIRMAINPRAVITVKFNGKKVDDKVVSGVNNYFVIYVMLCLLVALLVALDPYTSSGGSGMLTSVSASVMCMSNTGVGLSAIISPTVTFVDFAPYTKIIMSIAMLFGRLEIFPMLLLFVPRTYRRGAI